MCIGPLTGITHPSFGGQNGVLKSRNWSKRLFNNNSFEMGKFLFTWAEGAVFLVEFNVWPPFQSSFQLASR